MTDSESSSVLCSECILVDEYIPSNEDVPMESFARSRRRSLSTRQLVKDMEFAMSDVSNANSILWNRYGELLKEMTEMKETMKAMDAKIKELEKIYTFVEEDMSRMKEDVEKTKEDMLNMKRNPMLRTSGLRPSSMSKVYKLGQNGYQRTREEQRYFWGSESYYSTSVDEPTDPTETSIDWNEYNEMSPIERTGEVIDECVDGKGDGKNGMNNDACSSANNEGKGDVHNVENDCEIVVKEGDERTNVSMSERNGENETI